jgi:hypothetical protein
MAGAPVTGYNLRHLQVAAKSETPTYKDINYATTFEFPISQDSETLRADGSAAVTAQGAPEGGGSIGFASIDLATMAVMTGGSTSETGTAGTRITRLEVESTYSPPAVIVVGWIPNVDGNSTSAGLRVTVPNAKLTMPSGTFGQESWSEMSSDLSFVGDENEVMLIWEELATAPTFTSGVIPTNLEPPS